MVCDQEHPPARAQTENVLLLTFDDIPRMKSSDTPNPFYSFEAAEVLRRRPRARTLRALSKWI